MTNVEEIKKRIDDVEHNWRFSCTVTDVNMFWLITQLRASLEREDAALALPALDVLRQLREQYSLLEKERDELRGALDKADQVFKEATDSIQNLYKQCEALASVIRAQLGIRVEDVDWRAMDKAYENYEAWKAGK